MPNTLDDVLHHKAKRFNLKYFPGPLTAWSCVIGRTSLFPELIVALDQPIHIMIWHEKDLLESRLIRAFASRFRRLVCFQADWQQSGRSSSVFLVAVLLDRFQADWK